MKSLSKREKVLILIVILLGLLYAYYTLYLSTVLAKYFGLKLDLENLNSNSEIRAGQKSISNYNQLTLEEKLINKYNSALSAIPNNRVETQVVHSIKYFADSANVALNNITIENTFIAGNEQTNISQDKKDISNFDVKVNVFGEINNIINFIALLENDSRICTVSDIGLNKVNSNVFQNNINLHYYFRESKITD